MSVTEAEFAEIRDRMAANREPFRKLELTAGPWKGKTGKNLPVAQRSKFGNVKKEVDGHVFDSSAEARRYIELKAMQAAGQIANLELQPRYTLLDAFTDGTGKKHRKLEYVSDFRYLDGGGRTVVEDAKGFRTPVYLLKRKLFASKYPLIDFREVK